MSGASLSALIHSASSNAAVRSGLLLNPRAAFAKAGIELPPDVEVTVSETGTWGIHLSLGQAGGVGLSEEFLDGTSGGAGCAQP
ncbi:MAG: hypothetical protein RLZ04_2072 [Actinomycetota bacterium]|jgi:hypothetical protein